MPTVRRQRRMKGVTLEDVEQWLRARVHASTYQPGARNVFDCIVVNFPQARRKCARFTGDPPLGTVLVLTCSPGGHGADSATPYAGQALMIAPGELSRLGYKFERGDVVDIDVKDALSEPWQHKRGTVESTGLCLNGGPGAQQDSPLRCRHNERRQIIARVHIDEGQDE